MSRLRAGNHGGLVALGLCPVLLGAPSCDDSQDPTSISDGGALPPRGDGMSCTVQATFAPMDTGRLTAILEVGSPAVASAALFGW